MTARGGRSHQAQERGRALQGVKLSFLAAAFFLILSARTLLVKQSPAPAAPAASTTASATAGAHASAGATQGRLKAAARTAAGLTEDIHVWRKSPKTVDFQAPLSRCILDRDGTVRLPEAGQPGRRPFLFDLSQLPGCPDCPAGKRRTQCCTHGVCGFEGKLCGELYPGKNMSAAVAGHLMDQGFRLRMFSPCELFARIRGRTLWFMGDSQTWAMYLAAECFLREFALSLERTPAVEKSENERLKLVEHIPAPRCLRLALSTRVCVVRVDYAADMQHVVLPRLLQLVPSFHKDIVVFNTGMHYGPMLDLTSVGDSQLFQEVHALAQWRQAHKARLPRIVWMDIPPQHFSNHEGTYPPGGKKPMECRPLEAFFSGDPVVSAGGRRNIAVAQLIPQLADAHLHTWAASAPLWRTHQPGECSHWCSPSAYHLWLYLLNELLRDRGLGNPALVPDRPAGAAATAAAAAG